ncbi:hypothetical protein J6590_037919, partial [Homalodisca vitripennis]
YRRPGPEVCGYHRCLLMQSRDAVFLAPEAAFEAGGSSTSRKYPLFKSTRAVDTIPRSYLNKRAAGGTGACVDVDITTDTAFKF